MTDRAHILETAHTETPQALVSIQQTIGAVGLSRSVDDRVPMRLRLEWAPASPGEIRGVEAHIQANTFGTFEYASKLLGRTFEAVYVGIASIQSNRAGFGSISLEIEEVN